jgi:hypothetical protein
MAELVNEVSGRNGDEDEQELPTMYASVKALIANLLEKCSDGNYESKIGSQSVMICARYLLESLRSHCFTDGDLHALVNSQRKLSEPMEFNPRFGFGNQGGMGLIQLRSLRHYSRAQRWKVLKIATATLISENTVVGSEERDYFLNQYEANLNFTGIYHVFSHLIHTFAMYW